jgi:hypothetical protein
MQLDLHDGSLFFNKWTSVIYKGKEFNAPVDIHVLMTWDYIIHLLKNKL